MNPTITIMTKAPIPGRVKTRLAKSLGPQVAATIHTLLFEHTLALARFSGLPVRVALDGINPTFTDAVRDQNIPVDKQVEGSLGMRLKHASEEPGRHIFLGSDCVTFKPQWLQQAALSESPIAIGRASDGGYWCIAIDSRTAGLREAVFDGMPWSQSTLFDCTLAAVSNHGFRFELLPECYDIDTAEQLQRLLVDPDCPADLRTAVVDLL
jgi:hypothetical protein